MTNTDITWVDGFQKAVALYLVQNDYVVIPGTFTTASSALSTHIQDCGFAAVSEIDQEVDTESVFDTFDSNRSRPASYISAKFTCNCGEYTDVTLSREATLGDIMYGVLHAND